LVLPTTPDDDIFSRMDILAYLKTMSREERADFARRCGTTIGHLNNVAYGCKPCSAELAMAIEEESQRSVVAETMVPGCRWHVIRGTKQAAA
jgi:DNA-binding transcriptional regulator YdaS (Cro superfamily)